MDDAHLPRSAASGADPQAHPASGPAAKPDPNGRAGEGYSRDETLAHRIDRNFSEQLQELRVLETGVQILFAFLLGIAFQQRFAQTDAFQRWVYVATLLATATTVVLVVAPVAIHRFTFHEGLKDDLVRVTSRLTIAGLSTLMLAIVGSLLLVLDWVIDRPFAVSVAAVFLLAISGLWFLEPLRRRRRRAAAAAPERARQ